MDIGSVPLRRVAIPLLHFFALAGGALLRLPFGFVLHGLLLEVVESSADGDHHIFGLRHADERAIARVDGDFGFMTVFFNGCLLYTSRCV